ncbi:MAG: PorV/PorQ family protein, partial [candidate division Zixibacteria bacterium]|nr:PorV/PorQ family protein [candidate division Zixibacteria bacterium]
MARTDVNRILLIWVVVMALVALVGDVSLAATDVGCTAADFLMIGHGARAASLGGAYTAMASEATAAYWNPAGLTGIDGAQVTFGHFAWYQDITVEQMSFGFPVGERFSGALSATYVNYGIIQGYDVLGESSGDIVAYDWVGGISLAMAVSDRFSFGLTGKYVSQRLDDITASAFASDIGLRYSGESFALGATVINLGSD